MLIKRGTGI